MSEETIEKPVKRRRNSNKKSPSTTRQKQVAKSVETVEEPKKEVVLTLQDRFSLAQKAFSEKLQKMVKSEEDFFTGLQFMQFFKKGTMKVEGIKEELYIAEEVPSANVYLFQHKTQQQIIDLMYTSLLLTNTSVNLRTNHLTVTSTSHEKKLKAVQEFLALKDYHHAINQQKMFTIDLNVSVVESEELRRWFNDIIISQSSNAILPYGEIDVEELLKEHDLDMDIFKSEGLQMATQRVNVRVSLSIYDLQMLKELCQLDHNRLLSHSCSTIYTELAKYYPDLVLLF